MEKSLGTAAHMYASQNEGYLWSHHGDIPGGVPRNHALKNYWVSLAKYSGVNPDLVVNPDYASNTDGVPKSIFACPMQSYDADPNFVTGARHWSTARLSAYATNRSAGEAPRGWLVSYRAYIKVDTMKRAARIPNFAENRVPAEKFCGSSGHSDLRFRHKGLTTMNCAMFDGHVESFVRDHLVSRLKGYWYDIKSQQ